MGPFVDETVNLTLSIRPCFIGRIMQGLKLELDRFVGQFNRDVDGVLMSYSDLKILSRQGKIMSDSPLIHVDVSAKARIFRPAKGSALQGEVTKVSPGHIGLLVEDMFQASIIRQSLEQHLSFDGDSQSWVWPEDPDSLWIGEGCSVKFLVDALRPAHGLLYIHGELPEGFDDLKASVSQSTSCETAEQSEEVVEPSWGLTVEEEGEAAEEEKEAVLPSKKRRRSRGDSAVSEKKTKKKRRVNEEQL